MLSRIRIQVICTVAEKISKSNIFSVEIPILGGKKKGPSNVSAVYSGNQSCSSIIEYNTQ